MIDDQHLLKFQHVLWRKLHIIDFALCSFSSVEMPTLVLIVTLLADARNYQSLQTTVPNMVGKLTATLEDMHPVGVKNPMAEGCIEMLSLEHLTVKAKALDIA